MRTILILIGVALSVSFMYNHTRPFQASINRVTISLR